ncbi:GntR family transcriptional regulator [Enterobacter sp. BWH52]|uniref:GntR family transcriptional regulator n=1 Tax=Enterobacter sp. BWH52 TaxID=1686386 RepID=UPI000659256E|nr:GntR family transcriptional regulator [Enterobacter sp. BWH52]KLW15572.1 hypothetical protein SK47_03288 [Enterobacter sp. BWH52]
MIHVPIPKSVTDVVTDLIREMIICDELHFGQRIIEDDLKKILNVSKTPIRDALLRLSIQECLIDVRPRIGSFVFSITSTLIEELVRIRVLLENEALRLAIENNHSSFVKSLSKNISLQSDMIEKNNFSSYRKLDVSFHRLFLESCGDLTLRNAYKLIDSRFYAMRNRINFTPEYQFKSIAYHIDIFESIREKNIEEACRLNKLHIDVSFTKRAKLLLTNFCD